MLVYPIARLAYGVLSLYELGLIVWVILSWVRGPQADRVRRGIGVLYEPVLRPIRRVVKPVGSGGVGVDFSPLLLLLAIGLLQRIVARMC